jgi:hypothetical protein
MVPSSRAPALRRPRTLTHIHRIRAIMHRILACIPVIDSFTRRIIDKSDSNALLFVRRRASTRTTDERCAHTACTQMYMRASSHTLSIIRSIVIILIESMRISPVAACAAVREAARSADSRSVEGRTDALPHERAAEDATMSMHAAI